MNEVLKARIIEKSKEIGIDKIGFTHAEDFEGLAERLEKQQALGHHSGFEHPIIEERVSPAMIFDKPKTIIAIALAYPTKIRQKVEVLPNEPRGMFARASWGQDYHYILRDRMAKLIDYIREEAEALNGDDITFKPMVDTGELVDVAVAQRAGLGFIGRNGLLITEEFGSFVYLGEIITNLEFTPDEKVPFGCGDCRRCIDACPTNALLGDGRMNAQLCLSYQTQTKGYMPQEYRRKMGRVIYGCDICQIVCPFNKGKDFHFHPEMEPDAEVVQPELKPLLSISNQDFKRIYGSLAGSWRGKKPIQRNAIIALGNYREVSALPQLIELIEKDPRPVIRGTAAWAIAEIVQSEGNSELIEFLDSARIKETDSETIEAFEEAIDRLTARD